MCDKYNMEDVYAMLPYERDILASYIREDADQQNGQEKHYAGQDKHYA